MLGLLLCSDLVLAQPVANFTANPTVACAPAQVAFTSTSTGNPTSYFWNLGNSVTSVVQNPSVTYATPGTYTISLTVSNSSGTNTKTVVNYITILGPPIVNFAVNDTSGCPPHSVVFTNSTNPVTPGAATYSWSFGDGNISALQNPTHTYQNPGYYNVTLIATNSGGCLSSLTKPNYIHVYTPPVADFTGNANQCNYPATVNFTQTVTGTPPFMYYWDYGDGGTGTGSNPSHTYTVPGVYSVMLIVNDANGCKDTVLKPNYAVIGVLDANFTPTPAAACVNTNVQFNSTSLGAVGYFWDFGDGNTSTLTNPFHTYSTAGVYNVKLKVTSGTCSDSITVPFTVHPDPVANFNFVPAQPCPAPIWLQFNNLTTGGSSYAWSFGDGGTSTQANPAHQYLTNGFFTVKLIATSSFGCSDTVTQVDMPKIYDSDPTIFPLYPQGCAPLTVGFLLKHFTFVPGPFSVGYPYPGTSWSWNFGDGGTSTLDTPSHTYLNVGTYTVTCAMTTSNGCTVYDTSTVLVGPHPTASFIVAPDTICTDGVVYFINTSTGATNYLWVFHDGGLGTTNTNALHTFHTAGTYPVTLHAYNNGCEDSFRVDSLIVVNPPTSKPSLIYDCDTPLLVHFYDTLSIQPTSLIWYFGDGSSATTSNPSHIYQSYGNYPVKLVTFNSIYGCSDTSTIFADLINPSISFSTPDTAICKGDSVTFTPTYSGTNSAVFNWTINYLPAYSFPYPPTANQSANQWGYRFNNTGLYTITVSRMNDHACLDTFSRTNYIIVAKPTAGFVGSPRVGCVPLTVLFTDTSTNTPGAYSVMRDWTWGFGNTSSVTTATTNHIYNNAGIYNVQLIVTDNIGCKDTLLKQNYIQARKPIASFSASDTAVCIGQVVTFQNNSAPGPLTSSWAFGDGNTSTAASPTHSYNLTGTYTVTLVVTDTVGCKDTILKTVTVSKPNAAFSMSDTMTVCPPLNVLFTNLSNGAASYNWSFGNSAVSTLLSPSAIYTNPGVYPIVMIATDGEGCSDTAYGQANVLGYAGGLTYSPLEGCAPLTVQFNSSLVSVASIIWDFRDGVTQPANGSSSTSHTYVTPGAYVPQLLLSSGPGCLNASIGIDTIKVDGVYAGFTMSPACEKTLIQFQDTSFSFFSPVTSWYWSFNNGQSFSSLSNPTQFYPAAGTYPIFFTATNAHGCIDTVAKSLTIFPLPIITASPDTSICPGDAATLSAIGGISYVWSPAANLSCTSCQTSFASPVVTTNFIVAGTDVNGCVNTDTVKVNVQYITTSAVGDGGQICDDSTFQLLAYGAQHYEWKPAESVSNSTIPNPLASPHSTTVYTVTAWEGSCPPDSHTVKIVVYPKPEVNAGSDETIVAGNSVMLNASGKYIETFTWSPVATLNCETCSNPIASPKQTTAYTVLVTSNHGCKSTDVVIVHVLCDKSQLFIPNSFSPNADGQNDVFYPRGEGLKTVSSLRVYNRWGEIVFEKTNIDLNDASAGWDGTYKGAQLSPDVFVYVIDGMCEGGEPISWKGDVTLIR
jgi:gliding motility-associated-like protein